jgi:DNA-binding PadR family transcriptional regulator
MPGGRSGPGEFEQLVLLAVLKCGDAAFAPELAPLLERASGRRVSRGALYATLERLERKKLLRWRLEEPTPDRAGSRRRRFEVTPSGVAALRASRQALLELWRGLEATLGSRR